METSGGEKRARTGDNAALKRNYIRTAQVAAVAATARAVAFTHTGDVGEGVALLRQQEEMQLKTAGDVAELEEVIVASARTLTFEHLIGSSWLVVCVRGEYLLLLSGDSHITPGEISYVGTSSLDTERQRVMEEEEML